MNEIEKRKSLIHPVLQAASLNDPIVFACLTHFINGNYTQKTAYASCYSVLIQACKEYVEMLREKGTTMNYLVIPWVENDLEKQAIVLADQAKIKEILQKIVKR